MFVLASEKRSQKPGQQLFNRKAKRWHWKYRGKHPSENQMCVCWTSCRQRVSWRWQLTRRHMTCGWGRITTDNPAFYCEENIWPCGATEPYYMLQGVFFMVFIYPTSEPTIRFLQHVAKSSDLLPSCWFALEVWEVWSMIFCAFLGYVSHMNSITSFNTLSVVSLLLFFKRSLRHKQRFVSYFSIC